MDGFDRNAALQELMDAIEKYASGGMAEDRKAKYAPAIDPGHGLDSSKDPHGLSVTKIAVDGAPGDPDAAEDATEPNPNVKDMAKEECPECHGKGCPACEDDGSGDADLLEKALKG